MNDISTCGSPGNAPTVRAYRCAVCGSPTECVRATMRGGEALARAVCSECGNEGPLVVRNVPDVLVPQRRIADVREEFACSGCGWAFTFRPGEAWATGPFRYCPGCGVPVGGNGAL